MSTFNQTVLKFPVGQGKEVAKIFAEHGIITNLSYSVDDGIFNTKICAIITFPVEKADLVTAKFHQYIQP